MRRFILLGVLIVHPLAAGATTTTKPMPRDQWGAPPVEVRQAEDLPPQELASVRRMAQLHQRLALTELARHEFLDAKFSQERSTFSDGTTVTVDWETKTVSIHPDLPPPK